MSPPVRIDSIVTRNSRGATIRSWNSSTEKTVRPAAAPRRRRSAMTGTMTAVEDSASAAPSMSAAAGAWPSSSAATPSARLEANSCNAPSPNTSRRSRVSRSNESSSPIMKSRNTTPNSAMGWMARTSSSTRNEKAPMRCDREPSP